MSLCQLLYFGGTLETAVPPSQQLCSVKSAPPPTPTVTRGCFLNSESNFFTIILLL